MTILEWILAILAAILFLSNILVAIYTRVEKRLELIIQMRHPTASKGPEHQTSSKNGGSGKLLGKLYYAVNPYAYGLMRYLNILTGCIPSGWIRRLLYRGIFNMDMTEHTVVYGGSEFRSPWNIHLGKCTINNRCLFDGRSGITVADDVVFGVGVHLWTEEHAVNDPEFRVLEENRRPIVIERHAWICSDSTILPGVHVGEGAVVASRACVTKDCEPFGIYAGVPAHKIGERMHDLTYQLSGKPTWHFY